MPGAIYIPVMDDPIDRRMAEYLNNYPEKQRLKVMFSRESQGVYKFGIRRVAIKVDNGRIHVRVGGGYLSIDEFIDQYNPVELQRIERSKDPMLRTICKSIGRVSNGSMRTVSPTQSYLGARMMSPLVARNPSNASRKKLGGCYANAIKTY